MKSSALCVGLFIWGDNMKKYIIVRRNVKDIWEEIDRLIKHKGKYVTDVDNKDMVVTLGNEQYIYRECYSTLSEHTDINGWMLSDYVKSMRSDIVDSKIKKLTALYKSNNL